MVLSVIGRFLSCLGWLSRWIQRVFQLIARISKKHYSGGVVTAVDLCADVTENCLIAFSLMRFINVIETLIKRGILFPAGLAGFSTMPVPSVKNEVPIQARSSLQGCRECMKA